MLYQSFRWSLLFVSLSLFFVNCKKEITCDDVMCTQEYRSYTLQVLDGAGQPAIIDKIETHVGTSYVSTVNQSVPINSATYVIASDDWLQALGKNLDLSAEVWIYRNGNIVSKIPYQFKTDCCHLSLISGNSSVVIP